MKTGPFPFSCYLSEGITWDIYRALQPLPLFYVIVQWMTYCEGAICHSLTRSTVSSIRPNMGQNSMYGHKNTQWQKRVFTVKWIDWSRAPFRDTLLFCKELTVVRENFLYACITHIYSQHCKLETTIEVEGVLYHIDKQQYSMPCCDPSLTAVLAQGYFWKKYLR